MPPRVDESLVHIAAKIAAAAGARALKSYRSIGLGVERKPDGSEVTEADRDAERYVRGELARLFPDDTIIGEEEGPKIGTSGRTWTIDPIDGTASFVRGVPLFATLLALIDEHGPAIGIVELPALGQNLIAARGVGAFESGRACSVSPVQRLNDAFLASSAFDADWWPAAALEAVLASGARTRTWGDAYGYFLVATGKIEAMIDPPVKPWDIAPMLVAIPEAGGRCTTWQGRAWDGDTFPQSQAWVATNGHVHDQILALLQ